jgi:hypothetical protein
VQRTVLALVAGTLIVAPATAHAAAKPKPKPKPLPLCLTVADAKGDSGLEGTPTGDPALDLTSVRFSTADNSLVTTFTVDKWADRPTASAGNRFQATFTVAGKVVDIYYKNSPTREQEANAFYQQGIRVNGTFVTDAVTAKVSGNAIAVSVKLNVLKSAVGATVQGAKATAISGTAMGSYVATNEAWDKAETPGSFVVGGACR